jgi:signal transduction histidine kinase/DNA-binding response OmpR family regulator
MCPAGRTLWVLLAALVAVPLLVFTGAAAVSYNHHFRDAEERLVRFLDVVHEHAAKVFETQELAARHVNLLLRGLTDADIVAREAEIYADLKRLADGLPELTGIWICDEKGHPLASSVIFPVPRDLDLSDRAYFAVHRDGKTEPSEAFIGGILYGRRINPEVPFFQLSIRREHDGHFTGVTTISSNPGYFETFYRQAARSGFDTVSLVREDGAFLARFPSPANLAQRLPSGHPFLKAVTQNPAAGVFENRSAIDGAERILAYRRLSHHPVYVKVGLDRSRILGAWRSTMLSHLVVGGPATLGFAFLAFLALVAVRRAQRESDALGRLEEEARQRAAIEEQLRQAQKMEAIGRLTGGIAHDFNNLLQIAIGNMDMLRRRLSDGDARNVELMQSALEGITRAAGLTRQLLAFARRQPLAPRTVDVNRLVEDVADLLRGMLGETIRLDVVLARELGATYVDANQLESALVNLAVNARDAMPDGGRLTIETASVALGDAEAAANPEISPGPYVRIAVTDTGTGMTPEVQAKAFEPFFTTKAAGQGTGLGLAQVYGFVRQSGGHIEIDSTPGRGTSVQLYLPRRLPRRDGKDGHDGASLPQIDAVDGGNRATVLVVEDEDGVRRFVCAALRDLGYEVLEAAGARQALDLLSAHPEVALLVTDVVMPDMNGRDLADRAMQLRPGISVLFMTGYAKNAIIRDGILDRQARMIAKPFTVAELAAKAREILAEPPAAASVGEVRGDHGSLHILVVDDEPLVAMSLVDMLEEQGHAAVEVMSAEEALDLLSHDSFDLVITDHTMPGMTGSELARVIRERWPNIGIVLSTGHVDLPDPEAARLPRLDKPCGADQVRWAVERARRRQTTSVSAPAASQPSHQEADKGQPPEPPA